MTIMKHSSTLQRGRLVGLIAVFVLFGRAPPDASAADAVFEVVVDDAYKKPLLRFTPPKDKNGDTPREVLDGFLQDVNDDDFAAAAKRCHFGWRKGDGLPDPKDWPTIEGEKFTAICRAMRERVRHVTLAGTTGRQKSGYWSIEYKFKDAAGNEGNNLIYLLRIDDVWKIRETSINAFMHHLDRAAKKPLQP